MKFLDQMNGMKAAAADPMLHIGLLIGVVMMPRDQSCGTDHK